MKIVTANRLRDGVAVYFTGHDWSESIREARVAHDSEHARALHDAAKAHEQDNRVIASYLIAVRLDGDTPQPIDKKERVRAVGPSVRHDLNRPN